MAEESGLTIANRNSPLPLISVDAPSDERTPGGKRGAIKKSLSAEKLRSKLEGLQRQQSETQSPRSIQDRLFTKLLEQIIPEDDSSDPDTAQRPTDKGSSKFVSRPNFSIPTMSNNFRRFNARIGVMFAFQNQVIRLFTWKEPTHTISFLAIYTFVCLDPTLIAVVPLAACLFLIMVPAFLARHPPPPSNLPTDLYPLSGPPLAPAKTVKPAPDLSKDFFYNMRDLQNVMEDFSRVHDATIAWLAPPTNFSNEQLSSIIFLLLFATSCGLFITAHLLPWRAIALTVGWAAVCAGHPSMPSFLESIHADRYLEHQDQELRSAVLSAAATDIDMESAPESREVEIFDLQRRSMRAADSEFEPFLFSASPYVPLSPARTAGDRPRGAPFFEDVQPPAGWRWADKKWTLDLLSREWVEERCVTGVEVEVEGERWVSDILYDDGREGRAAEAKGKKREKVVTWEEGNGAGRKGEWRRRRWVRMVQRKGMEEGRARGGR